jgi:tetratricopeptide (TPR) repeat protein
LNPSPSKTNGSAHPAPAPLGEPSPNELYLQEVLQQLARDRLIVSEASGEYAFRHALTRDAIYGTLVRAERQPLHQAVADSLESLFPDRLDTYLADLAYHFHEAGAWDKALDYGSRAGAQAQAMYAPHEAIQHCTLALEAAAHAGRMPPPALYRTRGQAYELIGDFDLALADFENARETAQSLGDTEAEWQSLIDIGFLWAARDYGRTGEYLRQALDVARRLGDDTILGHSLNRVGNWYANIEHMDLALRYHREALELFQAQNDRRGLAETYDLLGLISLLIADMVQSERYYSQAVALFRELGDRRGLSSALANFSERGNSYLAGLAAHPVVPIAKVTAETSEAVELAQEIGWRSGESYARFNLASALKSSGNYLAALDQAGQALALADEIEHQQWRTYGHNVLCLIYTDLLAGAEAQRHAEQALTLAMQIGSLNFVHFSAGVLVSACLLQDRLSRAEFVLGTTIGQPELIAGVLPSLDEVRAKRLTATIGGRLCCRGLAGLALARGKASATLDYIGEMINTSPNVGQQGTASLAQLIILSADSLIALGRAVEAEAPLLASLADSQARGGLPMVWRIHAALSRVYHALGQIEAAGESAAQCETVVRQVAAHVPAGALHDNFLQRALAMIAPRPT